MPRVLVVRLDGAVHGRHGALAADRPATGVQGVAHGGHHRGSLEVAVVARPAQRESQPAHVFDQLHETPVATRGVQACRRGPLASVSSAATRSRIRASACSCEASGHSGRGPATSRAAATSESPTACRIREVG